MRNLCSRCGADLAMVGRSHRCIPRSRGGVEGHAGLDPQVAEAAVKRHREGERELAQVTAFGCQSANSLTVPQAKSGSDKGGAVANALPQAGIKPGPRDKRSRDANVTVLAGTTRDAKPAGAQPPGRQSIPKGRAGAKRLGVRGPAPGTGGRPRKGDEGKTLMAKKPWEAEGVSMATWYRRKKEQKTMKRNMERR